MGGREYWRGSLPLAAAVAMLVLLWGPASALGAAVVAGVGAAPDADADADGDAEPRVV